MCKLTCLVFLKGILPPLQKAYSVLSSLREKVENISLVDRQRPNVLGVYLRIFGRVVGRVIDLVSPWLLLLCLLGHMVMSHQVL